uniref:DUF2442 domain-containing protein n=1 Tax=Globodera rostochiensis TaxID=31243 RepID=A0A914H2E6_GLORO
MHFARFFFVDWELEEKTVQPIFNSLIWATTSWSLRWTRKIYLTPGGRIAWPRLDIGPANLRLSRDPNGVEIGGQSVANSDN